MATFFKAIQKILKNWYIPAIIGVLLTFLGIYLFTLPLETYARLVILFSVSFLVTGILETWFSILNRNDLEGWGRYLASGLFSLAIGILLLSKPELSAVTLPLFVGFSLLFRSVQGLGFAFELKSYGILKWGNLAIVNVLGVLSSFVLIFNPVVTGISLVIFMAVAFVFAGVSAIVVSFQLKNLYEHWDNREWDQEI